MYTEEYESRGFPFRDFLLKLILIVIFVFLLIWLLPKFVTPTVKNASDCADISPLTSQIFADNLERMKEAAITYYTDERLPKEVGDSDTMTLADMIGKKLLVPLIDKNGKACDVEKSYVKITKLDDEYLLKVNLKCSDKEDYILVHLGCYTYCDSYVCEKQSSTVAVKSSKTTSIVSIKDSTTTTSTDNNRDEDCDKDCDDDCDKECDDCDPTPTPTPSDEPTPTPEVGYIYEYKKTTGAVFSAWTSWSNWSKTSCSTSEINCNNNDITCLKKLQRFDRKEKIGSYEKKYVKTRQELRQTGSYQQKSCSKYNYVIINNTTYATTTTTTYTTINTVTSTTSSSTGSWTLVAKAKEFANPPRDTANYHYEFVGANYSYCEDTCTSLPNYYYDVYKLNSSISTVTNTTSTPGETSTSTDTSSSTSSTVSASCGEYVTKTIPIYGYITVSEVATRREPLYGTVCYESTKTRTLKNSGSTKTKWSKYNDTSLLKDGWYYTGAKKKA